MATMSSTQAQSIIAVIANDPDRLRQFCLAISMRLVHIEELASEYMNLLSQHLTIPHPLPMHTSNLSGNSWVNELLDGHPVRCFNALRMNRDTFLALCHVLEYKYYINSKAYISVKERVAWFLRTLSHRCANRDSMERFQHSGSSISIHFGDILEACGRLGKDIVKPRDPQFRSIPSHIQNNQKYYPTFKDCIGALDGCHVELTVPERDRVRFINRKGVTTTNVLAVCDFDMLFVFVCAGWEGSAHDTRVYLSAINDSEQRFPTPPPGKYYLGDKGYPDRQGLMTPHTRVRYHLSEFRSENPRCAKEKFNSLHSSLRSAIERSFGVLKARWQILRKVPSYPLLKQMKIVNACFALHNYTRLSSFGDPCFAMAESSPYFIPQDEDDIQTDPSSSRPTNIDGAQSSQTGAIAMVQLKERLTNEMRITRN